MPTHSELMRSEDGMGGALNANDFAILSIVSQKYSELPEFGPIQGFSEELEAQWLTALQHTCPTYVSAATAAGKAEALAQALVQIDNQDDPEDYKAALRVLYEKELFGYNGCIQPSVLGTLFLVAYQFSLRENLNCDSIEWVKTPGVIFKLLLADNVTSGYGNAPGYKARLTNYINSQFLVHKESFHFIAIINSSFSEADLDKASEEVKQHIETNAQPANERDAYRDGFLFTGASRAEQREAASRHVELPGSPASPNRDGATKPTI